MMLLWAFLILVLFLLSLMIGFTAYSAHKVEQLMPAQGSFVDLGHTRLHIVDQGQGPAILMVHGLAGNLRQFTYGVSEPLTAHYRVICVDRPGSGYSSRSPSAPVSLQAQADTLSALLIHLNIQEALVVGHSLGGAVALSMAQRHPSQVKGLALIAPLTKLPAMASPAFKVLNIPVEGLRHLLAWTLATPLGLSRINATVSLIFGPEKAPRDFATRGGGLMALRPSHFVGASTDLAAGKSSMSEIEAGYAAMKLPVHVLFAREDRILNCQENGQALVERLPGTQLTLLTGGHMLPITQIETTTAFIEDMARQVFA